MERRALKMEEFRQGIRPSLHISVNVVSVVLSSAGNSDNVRTLTIQEDT